MAHNASITPDSLPTESGYARDVGPSKGPDHQYDQGHTGEHHVVPVSTYVKVMAALMVLLVITLVAALPAFDFGAHFGNSFHWVNIFIAVSIAVIKAVLIMLFFMHVKYSSKLTGVFAVAAFVFVLIMFALTLSDYQTRSWLETLGK